MENKTNQQAQEQGKELLPDFKLHVIEGWDDNDNEVLQFETDNKELEWDGIIVAETPTRSDFNRSFANEMCNRYNQYPKLKAENKELREALGNILEWYSSHTIVALSGKDIFDKATELLNRIK